jgi:hypothetical protein
LRIVLFSFIFKEILVLVTLSKSLRVTLHLNSDYPRNGRVLVLSCYEIRDDI